MRRPDVGRARDQHASLCELLAGAGAEVLSLPHSSGLTPDAVYAHDASLLTDRGVICLRMGKPARCGEPRAHSLFYESAGIPVSGWICEPGTAEAGDLVWLDRGTLLAGRGYRTNMSGIAQLQALLGEDVRVVACPLPHGTGPGTCLHLMSLISLLDEQTALVDLPWLSVETVELLMTRGVRLVEIEPSERESLACNVLALGEGRLIALAENTATNARLRKAGFDVLEFSGSEIAIDGGGGPTCLTRPVWRAV
jgi:N-dimethylarginine dimethylaminohydrolase